MSVILEPTKKVLLTDDYFRTDIKSSSSYFLCHLNDMLVLQ